MIDRDQLISACKGVYTLRDTARHFDVSVRTVRRRWADAPDSDQLPEPPNIANTETTADLILADTQILLDRGHTLTYVAGYFHCTPDRIRHVHAAAGRRYTIRDDAGRYAA